MTDIVLEFPAPADPISMNEGDNWSVRERAALWRNRSFYAWIDSLAHSDPPRLGPSRRAFGEPAEIFVTLPFRRANRRDPINFAKTVKHIVDGFVLANAWPDDTPDYVTQHIPTLVVGDLPVVVRVSARSGCTTPRQP